MKVVAKVDTKIFKIIVSTFIVAEICFFSGLLFTVLAEYDPVFVETAGLIMITYSSIMALAVLLYSLFSLIKWQPNITAQIGLTR